VSLKILLACVHLHICKLIKEFEQKAKTLKQKVIDYTMVCISMNKK
jgi:hypothetical protein